VSDTRQHPICTQVWGIGSIATVKPLIIWASNWKIGFQNDCSLAQFRSHCWERWRIRLITKNPIRRLPSWLYTWCLLSCSVQDLRHSALLVAERSSIRTSQLHIKTRGNRSKGPLHSSLWFAVPNSLQPVLCLSSSPYPCTPCLANLMCDSHQQSKSRS